ncbi:stabilin-2-like isoform X2 [Macrosteles quadrilineatus]|uniref:stabilin-2-like isoform X2 n=1 Tax=Macrosteles quadrilineatus TaxID=74068 RepID=UPI0023E2BA0B|nr:stabilin-2-like isoform X2 [Macrosteles quadrilineatus]
MDSRIVCLCLLVLFVVKSRTQPVNNTTTGVECLTNDECISGNICIAKKCKDPCDKVCGLNTICVVHEGATLCLCKPNYEGDPFTECKSENAECTDDSMCTTDKSCIGHNCVDPCLNYCGINTVCRVVNHQPVCACLKGFFYNQDIGCSPKRIPECQTNSYCPEDRSCRLQKCVDPCQDGVCGNNTECHVKNHYPVCSCKVGFIGDAYNECVPYGSITTTDNKEVIQKPIQEKKTFIRVEEEKSWLDALKDCNYRGMKLATIESNDEWNDFVDTLREYTEINSVWVGGHEFDQYPNFVWISTGQQVSYHWAHGKPDDDSYHCLAAFSFGFVNFKCDWAKQFVCEKI